MYEKEKYVFQTMEAIYERSLDEASNVVARAQNPLTALSVIIAILVYMAQSISSSSIPKVSLENIPVIGSFYVLLALTVVYVIQSIYNLWRGFRQGGFKYELVGSPSRVESLVKSPGSDREVLIKLIEKYKSAGEFNIRKNRKRMVYIRVATEKIILAVASCFFAGFLFCVITVLK